MGKITFSHKQVGKLQIDNGIDDAQWGYNLNTQTFPTYGGEVVQILSVYIDDLTLSGTCATYAQIEAIYSYFAEYLQVATQGKNAQPGDGKSSYNLTPVYFWNADRNWFFKIYPKSIPGFRYGREVVAPTWQLSAHVVDDSPDLNLIKDGIKALAQNKLSNDPLSNDKMGFKLSGEISPSQGNPDTDPFQTFTEGIAQQQQVINKYSEYYNSLIPAYARGDFSALTAGIGSKPNQTPNSLQPGSTVSVPAPGKSSSNSSNSQPGSTPSGRVPSGKVPHNAAYQQHYRFVFNDLYKLYRAGGCAGMRARYNMWVNKVFSSSISRVESQAIFDATLAFASSPYNCKG